MLCLQNKSHGTKTLTRTRNTCCENRQDLGPMSLNDHVCKGQNTLIGLGYGHLMLELGLQGIS